MKFQFSVLSDCTQSVPLASVPERGQPSQCHRRDVLSEDKEVSSQGKSVEKNAHRMSWVVTSKGGQSSHMIVRLVANGCQWQLSVSPVARSSLEHILATNSAVYEL